MTNNRVSPSEIKVLKDTEIFVFGSNEAGIHGAGAARYAMYFGAHIGGSFGMHGSSFAIPTKDWRIQTLPLDHIGFYVSRFIDFAKHVPDLVFLVTPIGCGLAGYQPKDIAPLFKEAMSVENIHLPQSFWDILLS